MRPMSDAQRAMIFALAGQHGLSDDDIRAMTPGGSIRALTMRQAGDLIDRLRQGGRRPPAPPPAAPRHRPRLPTGTMRFVSDAQWAEIARLRDRLRRDWGSDANVDAFLAKRRHGDGRPLTAPPASSRDAQTLIGVLRSVTDNIAAAKARDAARPPADISRLPEVTDDPARPATQRHGGPAHATAR